jgi:hypothetical protein
VVGKGGPSGWCVSGADVRVPGDVLAEPVGQVVPCPPGPGQLLGVEVQPSR